MRGGSGGGGAVIVKIHSSVKVRKCLFGEKIGGFQSPKGQVIDYKEGDVVG